MQKYKEQKNMQFYLRFVYLGSCGLNKHIECLIYIMHNFGKNI